MSSDVLQFPIHKTFWDSVTAVQNYFLGLDETAHFFIWCCATGVLLAMLVTFLLATSTELRIRSLRLYVSAMSSMVVYLAIGFFPAYAQLAQELFGIRSPLARIAVSSILAFIAWFSFLGYFISTIVEWSAKIGSTPKALTRNFQINYDGKKGTIKPDSASSGDGAEAFITLPLSFVFWFVPALIAHLLVCFRYGLLPLILFSVVAVHSWQLVAPQTVEFIDVIIRQLDAMFNSPKFLKFVQWMLKMAGS